MSELRTRDTNVLIDDDRRLRLMQEGLKTAQIALAAAQQSEVAGGELSESSTVGAEGGLRRTPYLAG